MDQKEYIRKIEAIVQKEVEIAKAARSVGVEMTSSPEIYIAKDLADKVEGLIEFKGIAKVIRELEKETKNEEEIAFKLVDKVVSLSDLEKEGKEKVADTAVRAALAFLTQGSVAAPLEGIAKIKILKNPDDSEYLSVYYAGPIRAAGGTAEAISVVVADYTRKALGLSKYKPTLSEIGRYVEEINWYNRRQHLQYLPTKEEIETIVKNVPVCIDGEPTEDYEVSNYRNLGRVETNRVRGGMCLVLAEGIAQKAPKLLKRLKPIQEKYGLDWSWLEGLLVKRASKKKPGIQKKLSNLIESEMPEEFQNSFEKNLLTIGEFTNLVKAGSIDIMEDYIEEEPQAKGSDKFLREVPAGRPVFSYPRRKGGFNLRYGRTRASGYAAVAMNPATMHLLDDFIAIGTQIRLELPGKAGIVTPCDGLNGPTVLLKDGSVLQVDSYEDAKKIKNNVIRIISLGDILISAGDFFENNQQFLPSSYCEEWWAKQVKEAIKEKKPDTKLILKISRYLKRPFPKPNIEIAIKISNELNVPLHPKYTFYWNRISNSQLNDLVNALKNSEISENEIKIENDKNVKEILEEICVFHSIKNSKIVISEHANALLTSIGRPEKSWGEILKIISESRSRKALKTINKLSNIEIKDRAPTTIGARMGRPEKARPRKMVPAPHVLFPTGEKKGRVRNLAKLYEENKTIKPEIALFKCEKCNRYDIYPKCSVCGSKTKLLRFCPNCKIVTESKTCSRCGRKTVTYSTREINIHDLVEAASKKLGMGVPAEIKGILGMSSKNKVPEAIEKGFLRAKQDIYAFKDGTIRHDATDAPITHFKPKEIGTSIETLKKLGYSIDIYGNPLESDDQVLELKPQDIIVSSYGEESAVNYLLKTSKFVDELLVKYYGLKSYYNAKKFEDLVGHLVIALAPHTSTGIIGRIIGSTKAKVCFAHPCFHDAKRRDCDGDEDAIMLLLDALINFSKVFLPDKRGGRMDAPLVITTKLNPLEIDDEVYDIDIVRDYPLSFYEKTEKKADPNEVNLLTFGDTIYGDDPFSGWSFTHDVSDINNAPISNTYTEGEMIEKLKRQLRLAEIIDAVDVKDVAEKIIKTHFLPDIKGNLRTFSKQKVRCTKCNAKYRRPPLSGRCLKCGGKLTFTVHRGTIEKYLSVTKEMIQKYNLSPYIAQQINLLESNITSLFGKEEQSKLSSFN